MTYHGLEHVEAQRTGNLCTHKYPSQQGSGETYGD